MKQSSEILGNLNGERNYLINIDSEDFDEQIIKMLNFLQKKRDWSCIYVCTNKSSSVIRKKLEKNKFNLKKFFFIDAVQTKPDKKISNVFFALSPSALTNINTTITQLSQISQSHGFVFIDSINGFHLNNEENTLARFVRSLVAGTVNNKSKLILLATRGLDEKLLNKIKPFFDKVINL